MWQCQGSRQTTQLWPLNVISTSHTARSSSSSSNHCSKQMELAGSAHTPCLLVLVSVLTDLERPGCIPSHP
jgi:hypothetical protein